MFNLNFLNNYGYTQGYLYFENLRGSQCNLEISDSSFVQNVNTGKNLHLSFSHYSVGAILFADGAININVTNVLFSQESTNLFPTILTRIEPFHSVSMNNLTLFSNIKSGTSGINPEINIYGSNLTITYTHFFFSFFSLFFSVCKIFKSNVLEVQALLKFSILLVFSIISLHLKTQSIIVL